MAVNNTPNNGFADFSRFDGIINPAALSVLTGGVNNSFSSGNPFITGFGNVNDIAAAAFLNANQGNVNTTFDSLLSLIDSRAGGLYSFSPFTSNAISFIPLNGEAAPANALAAADPAAAGGEAPATQLPGGISLAQALNNVVNGFTLSPFGLGITNPLLSLIPLEQLQALMNPEVAEVAQEEPVERDELTVSGGTTFEGSNTDITATDGAGADTFSLGGINNTMTITGDSNANTFNISGQNNTMDIHNIGGDERINLTGAESDWEITERFTRDGGHAITMVNQSTGNEVTLSSDRGGRREEFLLSLVSYTA